MMLNIIKLLRFYWMLLLLLSLFVYGLVQGKKDTTNQIPFAVYVKENQIEIHT